MSSSLSVAVFETNNFRIGVAGDYLNHRSHNNAPAALDGIHDVGYTLEAGAFAEYYPIPFLRTRVELLQGITGADGFEANIMADFIFRPGPQWLLTAGPRLQVVNDKFASAFYSTTAADSVGAYNATGGAYTAGIDATARYNLTENFSLRAFADWNRLLGDAANSNLVQQRGSADQFQAGLGAAYKFNFSW